MTFDPAAADKAKQAEDDQLDELFRVARVALDDLELGVFWPKDPKKGQRLPLTAAGLLRVSRLPERDGYPTSSLGDGGGPASIVDENGDPMPPLNDPVGELVINPPKNLARMTARAVVGAVEAAVSELQRAVGHLLDATPPAPSNADPGCKSCATIGIWSPMHKAERCTWCYAWQREHRADPPEVILRAHHDGKRITTRMVAELLGSAPARRSTRKAS